MAVHMQVDQFSHELHGSHNFNQKDRCRHCAGISGIPEDSTCSRAWVTFGVILVVTFYCLLSTVLICKNMHLIQDNQVLLSQILDHSVKHSTEKEYTVSNQSFVEMFFPKTSAKLVDIRTNTAACPVCKECPTTEKPTPVEGHLQPVGILQELTTQKAVYECTHTCINPPIHIVHLVINEPDLVGHSWDGIGSSKQRSKQAAAYKALLEHYPEEAATIPASNIPENYNPTCKQRPPVRITDTQRAKC